MNKITVTTSVMRIFGLFLVLMFGMQNAFATGGSCFGTQKDFDSTLLELYDADIANDGSDAAIIAEIEDKYGDSRAVMVMDMSNFTSLSFAHPFPTLLAHLRHILDDLTDISDDNDGEKIGEIADDLFILFPDVSTALTAAFEMQDHLSAQIANGETIFPDLSVGIGYADKLIRVGNNACIANAWAQEVNFTFGAGEESADDGEILLTADGLGQLENEIGVGNLPPGVDSITPAYTYYHLVNRL